MSRASPVASSSRVTLDVLAADVDTLSTRPSSPADPAAQALAHGDGNDGGGDNQAVDMESIVLPEKEHKAEATDEEDEEAYERERQRRILENRLLLDSLGLQSSSQSLAFATPPQPVAKKKSGKRDARPVYDRSGYILSLPAPGDRRQRITCVEIPADRQLSKRIAEGEYTDCEHWWEGEARRWRFGHGEQGKADEADDEAEVGGVSKDFRWRKWLGLEKELRKEMKQRKDLNSRDVAGRGEEPEGQSTPSAYSLLSGDACHQCRRKSDKPRMKCRNMDPICRAVFCETCCKRYSYFEFDVESRSFICPLCKDCCNCANCIRKRKLSHLLGPGRIGLKSKDQLQSGMTVQAWLEKAGAVAERVAPFDRVRLVDQATDIVSPDLPPETPPPPAKKTSKRKSTAAKQSSKKKARKGGKADEEYVENTATRAKANKAQGLVIRIKVPKPQRRVKEVDSDGDTVDGYSDDSDEDMLSDGSSKLTSLSSLSAVPARLPFPPRHSVDVAHQFAAIPNFTTSPDGSPAVHGDLVRPHLVERQSTDSVAGDGSRRRKKPPPTANILRAPKYSLVSSPRPETPGFTTLAAEPETPLTAEPSPMMHNEGTQTFQSFSYDGYSTLPPFQPSSMYQPSSTLQPVPRPYGGVMSDLPPPYSHSPPRHLAWSLHQPIVSMQGPPARHIDASLPQELDMLSMATTQQTTDPAIMTMDDHQPQPLDYQHTKRALEVLMDFGEFEGA